jgi:hypothetical protein
LPSNQQRQPKRLSLELEATQQLKWTVHIAKAEPKKALVVYAVAMFAGLASAAFIGNPWMFPFGFMVILMGAADFVLPNRFSVGEHGAERRCGLSVVTLPWDRVKRIVVGEDGVKLSPLDDSSRLAPFRGVYLRANGNLQEIVSCVEYWRKRYASDVGQEPDGVREERDHQEDGSLREETRGSDTGGALPRDA